MASGNQTIETPSVSLTNDVTKTLTFDDNTADAATQGDSTLQTDGYATSPNRTADPNKTAEY